MMTWLSMSGMSQEMQLETREVLDVIKKWNFAVNARSEQTLRELYADRVVYYAQEQSKENCIKAQRKFFDANPSFKQKIVSDPTFVAYTSGVVKSTFTREVFQNGRWKKIPTYLLISYSGNDYKITGESDSETDRKAKKKPAIGVPMDIPQAEPIEKPLVDSTPVVSVDATELAQPQDSVGETVASNEDSTLINAVTKEVLSEETVAIPKKYVYTFIGLLGLVAILIVATRGSKKVSRKRQQKPTIQETTLVRNDKTFEGFVVALFDPHYFTLKRYARQTVYAGSERQLDFAPTLAFEFRNKEAEAGLAIECIFIPKLASRQILAYSANQINRYREFEEESGMEVYIVVGLEGDANDPKELFLIPSTALREGYLGYQDLQPFRKHGMFFYNSARQRLM